jgi:hypothetical protein
MSEFSEFDFEEAPEVPNGESPERIPPFSDGVWGELGYREIDPYEVLYPQGKPPPHPESKDNPASPKGKPKPENFEDFLPLDATDLEPEAADGIEPRRRKKFPGDLPYADLSGNSPLLEFDAQEIRENQRLAKEAIASGRAKHVIYSHGDRPFYAEFGDDASFDAFTRTLTKSVGAYHGTGPVTSAPMFVEVPSPQTSTALATCIGTAPRVALVPADWGNLRVEERELTDPQKAAKATTLRATLLAEAGIESEKPLSIGSYREKCRANQEFLKDAGKEIASALSLIERCPVLRTLVGETIDTLSTVRRKEFAHRLTDGHQVRDPSDLSDNRKTALCLNADYAERVTPAQLAGEICAWAVYLRGKVKDILVFSPEMTRAKLGIAVSVLEEFGETPSDRADIDRLEKRQARFTHGLAPTSADKSPFKVLELNDPSPRLLEAALGICASYNLGESQIRDSRFFNRDEADGAFLRQANVSGAVKTESGLEIDGFNIAVRSLIVEQRARLLSELSASGMRVFQEYPRLMDQLLEGQQVTVEWSLERSRSEPQPPLKGKFESARLGSVIVNECGLARVEDVMRIVVEGEKSLAFWMHGSAPDYDPRGFRELWGLGLV